MLGCLNCWNDLDVFRLEKREQHFSRLGVFPYHPRDSDLMREKIASQGGLEDTLKVIQENELRVSSISGEEVEVLLNTDVKKIGAYDRHSAPDKLGKKSPKKDLLGGGGKSKKTAADLRKKFGMAYATTVTLKVNNQNVEIRFRSPHLNFVPIIGTTLFLVNKCQSLEMCKVL